LFKLFHCNLYSDYSRIDEDLGSVFYNVAGTQLLIDISNTLTDLTDDDEYDYFPFTNMNYDGADMNGDGIGDIIITTYNDTYVYINVSLRSSTPVRISPYKWQ